MAWRKYSFWVWLVDMQGVRPCEPFAVGPSSCRARTRRVGSLDSKGLITLRANASLLMTSSVIASDANPSTVDSEERSWDLEGAVWTGEQEVTVVPEIKLRESRSQEPEYQALVGP
jgi:hypothetical protein